MKKWKAILFGTLLTLSLCTFTACGTEVNNADETVDEKDKNTKDKEKDTNENTAAEDETMEEKADNDGVKDNGESIKDSGNLQMSTPFLNFFKKTFFHVFSAYLKVFLSFATGLWYHETIIKVKKKSK